MKQFNLIIKLLAIGLILYVFMQQKGGYMAEIKGQKTEDVKQKTEAVKP
jgi:predicted membrane protein